MLQRFDIGEQVRIKRLYTKQGINLSCKQVFVIQQVIPDYFNGCLYYLISQKFSDCCYLVPQSNLISEEYYQQQLARNRAMNKLLEDIFSVAYSDAVSSQEEKEHSSFAQELHKYATHSAQEAKYFVVVDAKTGLLKVTEDKQLEGNGFTNKKRALKSLKPLQDKYDEFFKSSTPK